MGEVLPVEMSLHHFDMIRYLLAGDPTEILARR